MSAPSVPFAAVLQKEHEHLEARRKHAADEFMRARLTQAVEDLEALMAKPEPQAGQTVAELRRRVSALLAEGAAVLTKPISKPEDQSNDAFGVLNTLMKAGLTNAAVALSEPFVFRINNWHGHHSTHNICWLVEMVLVVGH